MNQTCIRDITTEQFQQEVAEYDGDVLVDFYTEWCPPCNAMTPVLDAVCGERRETIKVVKIDVEASVELSTRLKISSVPTFIIFRNGEAVAKTSGFQPKRLFDQWIDQSQQV